MLINYWDFIFLLLIVILRDKKENFEVTICNVRETEHLCLVFDLSDGVSLGVMCIILVECVCVCVCLKGPFGF